MNLLIALLLPLAFSPTPFPPTTKMRSVLVLLSALVTAVSAKTVVVTVGGNTTSNPMGVFQPANVIAGQGDVVLFNFTQGNHTATQSTFAGPCTPAHFTDRTINGFDSSFRDTHNGTAVTQLSFTVTDANTTIWFFDWNTCARGGVGGINVNESSNQTLDGFQRNAIRLNGTSSSASASSGHSATAAITATGPASSNTTGASSAANRALVQGVAALLPAAAVLASLAF